MWDVFISYASEDRDGFAAPLAEALRERGLKVWFDEFELKPGDGIRESIDKGLAQSRMGVVVLSAAFFGRHWTKVELGALFAARASRGSRIVPIWYGIDHTFILRESPMLADLKAIDAAVGVTSAAQKIYSLLQQTTLNKTEVGVIQVNEHGSPENVDKLLVEEMLLAYEEGKKPPFQLDIHKQALFNGIGLARLMRISDDIMTVYNAISSSADFRLIYSELEQRLASGLLDRKLCVEFRKLAPVIADFEHKIANGIIVILTRDALRNWLYSREEEAKSIEAYVAKFFSKLSDKLRCKMDLWMESEPYWGFGLYLSEEEKSLLQSGSGVTSVIHFMVPGWNATELPHQVIVQKFIPRLLWEAFVTLKLDTPDLIPDTVFDLQRWSLGLG